jgi:divalent metal cation (Fe/Co/Zn/Cd) transporter
MWLECFTVCYNTLEGLVAIGAGLFAGSVALVGFGFDSMIEVASGAALIWRLRADAGELRERRERAALRFVGACFLALAVYVGWDAIESLVSGVGPHRSLPGTALAFLSLVVMPVLARAKRRVAGKIGSPAMMADARQNSLCMYLSAILLCGLLLNAIWAWWWADPVAALAMVPIIANEGRQALRGKWCCPDCH